MICDDQLFDSFACDTAFYDAIFKSTREKQSKIQQKYLDSKNSSIKHQALNVCDKVYYATENANDPFKRLKHKYMPKFHKHGSNEYRVNSRVWGEETGMQPGCRRFFHGRSGRPGRTFFPRITSRQTGSGGQAGGPKGTVKISAFLSAFLTDPTVCVRLVVSQAQPHTPSQAGGSVDPDTFSITKFPN